MTDSPKPPHSRKGNNIWTLQFFRCTATGVTLVPGFEPGSKAPQASRISKLPHTSEELTLKDLIISAFLEFPVSRNDGSYPSSRIGHVRAHGPFRTAVYR